MIKGLPRFSACNLVGEDGVRVLHSGGVVPLLLEMRVTMLCSADMYRACLKQLLAWPLRRRALRCASTRL